jgi:hypothetical protein
MKHVIACATMLMVLCASLPLAAQCPSGYTCLDETQLKEVREIVDLHNCMVDEAAAERLVLVFDPQAVVITEEGQVFTDDTLEGILTWCTWKLSLTAKNNVVVTKQRPPVPPAWGFRLRLKFGLAWRPSEVGRNLQAMFDPVLLAEPFYWKHAHIQIHGGLRQAGVTLGWDLTNNLDIFGGMSVPYDAARLSPVFGLSLSFN